MNVFGAMVQDLTAPRQAPVQIPTDQYLEWKQQFSFDGLRDLRYGQSFCNHFGITDAALFYCRSVEDADRYIFSNYLEPDN
jgi:hypothetical protein